MPRIPTFTEVKRQNEKAAGNIPLPSRRYVPSFNDANRVIRGVLPQLANAPINPNDTIREARTGNLAPIADQFTFSNTIGHQAAILPVPEFIVTISAGEDIVTIQGGEQLITII
jgi:hypothetical protein